MKAREAKALGLHLYCTGKPCNYGHLCERYVSSYDCVECAKKRNSKRSRRGSTVARLNRNRKRTERQKIAYTALKELGINFGEVTYEPFKYPVAACSRAEALATGARRYFTGKPCKHGHISSRNVHSGCDVCRKNGGNYMSKETKQRQKRRKRLKLRAALGALVELGIAI